MNHNRIYGLNLLVMCAVDMAFQMISIILYFCAPVAELHHSVNEQMVTRGSSGSTSGGLCAAVLHIARHGLGINDINSTRCK